MKEWRAARLAAVIALPVALLAGLLAFRTLSGMRAAPQASPTPAATGPVSMPAPSLADADTPICRGFIANLPTSPRGLQRRTVTAGIEQNAAYGNPPITISCGIRPAPSAPPDAVIYPISGVCWYADDSRRDATVWHTLDRRVPITVSFPASYHDQGEGDWLQEFRDTIVAWVPSLEQAPAICTPPSTAPS